MHDSVTLSCPALSLRLKNQIKKWVWFESVLESIGCSGLCWPVFMSVIDRLMQSPFKYENMLHLPRMLQLLTLRSTDADRKYASGKFPNFFMAQWQQFSRLDLHVLLIFLVWRAKITTLVYLLFITWVLRPDVNYKTLGPISFFKWEVLFVVMDMIINMPYLHLWALVIQWRSLVNAYILGIWWIYIHTICIFIVLFFLLLIGKIREKTDSYSLSTSSLVPFISEPSQNQTFAVISTQFSAWILWHTSLTHL